MLQLCYSRVTMIEVACGQLGGHCCCMNEIKSARTVTEVEMLERIRQIREINELTPGLPLFIGPVQAIRKAKPIWSFR